MCSSTIFFYCRPNYTVCFGGRIVVPYVAWQELRIPVIAAVAKCQELHHDVDEQMVSPHRESRRGVYTTGIVEVLCRGHQSGHFFVSKNVALYSHSLAPADKKSHSIRNQTTESTRSKQFKNEKEVPTALCNSPILSPSPNARLTYSMLEPCRSSCGSSSLKETPSENSHSQQGIIFHSDGW
jgi:hypothetical protein